MTTIEPAVRQQIVLASEAAASADPAQVPHEAKVAREAARLTAAVLNDRHPAARAVEQILASKVFTGTVVHITKEKSSTRGLVTLHTGTERTDDGTEQIRTERTDNPVGLAMAKQVKDLVGHKVVVWVEVEQTKNGQSKVRVLRHIEDRGVDDAAAVA